MCNPTLTYTATTNTPLLRADSGSISGSSTSTALKPPPPSSPKPLSSAPPPWHAALFISGISALLIQNLPSGPDLDQVATLDVWTRAEPWMPSLWHLGMTRAAIALSIWGTTAYMVCGPGWTQITNWKPGSSLRSNTPIHLKGFKTLCPFTSWSWIVLGCSYTLNAGIALSVAHGMGDDYIATAPHNWVLRLALVLWEMAAPCAMLVSTVIRYAIWEQCLTRKCDTNQDPTRNLREFRNVMMHNANSLYVLAEVALLGGLPVRWSEFSLAPLLGCAYVFFTWNMSLHWTSPEYGPQFIYYFMDTTMGKVTTLSLAVLLCALLLFYVLFAAARHCFVQWIDQAILLPQEDTEQQQQQMGLLLTAHVLFVVVGSSLVCRFRD